jgi:hypothetical protein
MSLFDPFNIGIWTEINHLKNHIHNEDWGIWKRIDKLEQKSIPEMHEKFNHAGWGVWVRLDTLEQKKVPELYEKFNDPDWGVWARIVRLEEDNAALKERINKLETLVSNLEKMLVHAVNTQLGEKEL